ncbi:MAG TPA: monofunctional biosynthetic peptidoglycan transglycosylase [Paracoccaceae bacterium]|nr:monofunctional biosynthetic peptidoglycan transglycosylase [Paracoccaceae bacterium]
MAERPAGELWAEEGGAVSAARVRRRPLWRRATGWVLRVLGRGALFCICWVILYRFVNPPFTLHMGTEAWRLGGIRYEWRDLEEMSAWMPRVAAAAEDARFCEHLGFDLAAIQEALDDSSRLRGASTISQQVAKNAFLWQGRSWARKGLEAGFTALIELTWPKRRIMEVYLNIAEMDEGVFGVAAAAEHYFGRDASELSRGQAALIAAVLPGPRQWSAAKPTSYIRRRASSVAGGAETLLSEKRSACFEVAR